MHTTINAEKRLPEIGHHLHWPVRVLWYITNRCNLKCPYCLSASAAESEDFLSLEDSFHIVELLRRGGVSKVTFLGGEPLIYNDFLRVLQHLVHAKIRFSIVTNGLLVNDEVVDFFAAHQRSVISVQLSLHRPELLDRYAEIVRSIVSTGTQVNTLWLLTTDNSAYVEQFYRRMAQAGVTIFFLGVIGELGRAATGQFRDSTPGVEQVAEMLTKLEKIRNDEGLATVPSFKSRARVSQYLNATYSLRTTNHKCEAGISEFKIDALGRCTPCSFLGEAIREAYTTKPLTEYTSLETAWHGPAFQAFRERHLSLDNKNLLSSCLRCKYRQEGLCRPCLIHPSQCPEDMKRLKEFSATL